MTRPRHDRALQPAYAVVYTPKPNGRWQAHLVDFPSVKVDGPNFGVVKAKIAEAGRDHYKRVTAGTLPIDAPKSVVGYVYINEDEDVCRFDTATPDLF